MPSLSNEHVGLSQFQEPQTKSGISSQRNARNELTQAPANRNWAVLFPAELEFLRFTI